jgi:cytochrome c-type biogenesis protein
MEEQVFYQISLIAAFVAGMVALFAPCCISYLLPAYFGNIFKEKKRILFMTLVYSLGIFVVMLPVVLGAKVLSSLFFRLHDQTYIIGGVFMLVLAVISLLGIKLPMPKVAIKQKKNGNDIISTFTLGIISGVTSSCCAPVLVGVITLSALSPTVVQSLGVGAFYVLGMVTPLYLASLFIERRNILKKPLMRRKITVLHLGKRKYPIFVTNIIAALIFFITGGLTIILSSAGMLGMPTAHSPIVKTINNTALQVTGLTKSIPGLNLVVAVIGVYLVYRFIKSAFKEN